ncbi:MAG: hypothetical protein LBH43_10245 [Treponema sp.]|jgi:hypothetical protein|nr:hypothetical protein [Treponema sp.]
MNLSNKANAKAALFELLDEFRDGTEFPGILPQKEIYRRTGAMHYPYTFLRYLRMYRKEKGRSVVNINRARSIYKVIG